MTVDSIETLTAQVKALCVRLDVLECEMQERRDAMLRVIAMLSNYVN
jgi:hypothetical protein